MKLFECILVTLSPLHVGAGRSMKGIDNPTLRIPILTKDGTKEMVLIPAGTLKGVIRSAFERIAKERGENSCNIFDSNCEKKAEKMCITCRTFGNQKLASKVRFTDALPISDAKVFELPRVALGRESGAVIHPFSVEAIAPGTKMKFQMVVDLPDGDKRLQILMDVIEKMKRGELQFGGKKSIGMGWVKLEELKCR